MDVRTFVVSFSPRKPVATILEVGTLRELEISSIQFDNGGIGAYVRGVSCSVLQSARDASRDALRFRVTQFGQGKAELLRDRSQFLRDFVDVVSVIRLNEKVGFGRCPEF